MPRGIRASLAALCLALAPAHAARAPANGAELAEVCAAEQPAISRQCDLLILEVVFDLVTLERHNNPFNACPIALNPADALQERLDGLRVAVSNWLAAHPESLDDDRPELLVRLAVLESDVCAYR